MSDAKGDTIERLAHWLHDTTGESEADWTSWDDLSPTRRRRYRKLARALLTRPPDVLREAARTFVEAP
jgi:hypothetical protein